MTTPEGGHTTPREWNMHQQIFLRDKKRPEVGGLPKGTQGNEDSRERGQHKASRCVTAHVLGTEMGSGVTAENGSL